MRSIGKIPLLFTQSVSSNAGNVGDDGREIVLEFDLGI